MKSKSQKLNITHNQHKKTSILKRYRSNGIFAPYSLYVRCICNARKNMQAYNAHGRTERAFTRTMSKYVKITPLIHCRCTVPSMLFLRLCIVHSPRHVCNNPVYTVPMNRAIPVITPPKHCACTEPSIQFLCLYIVLVCNVCGTVKLRISIKPDAKYKPSDDVYSAHGHNYNYLHTLKWLYTSVSS